MDVAVDQVVVSIDGVTAIEIADLPDGISQLDVGCVGNDGLVVRLELRAIPVGPVQSWRTEELEERPLELATEDHVNDEVNAAVDGH